MSHDIIEEVSTAHVQDSRSVCVWVSGSGKPTKLAIPKVLVLVGAFFGPVEKKSLVIKRSYVFFIQCKNTRGLIRWVCLGVGSGLGDRIYSLHNIVFIRF